MLQLIRRNPEASPREEAIRTQVRVFRDKLKTLVKDRSRPTEAKALAGVDENAVAKLFEEVKVMFRDLPEKVEVKLQNTFRPGRIRRGRRIHPMMFEQLLFSPMSKDLPGGVATGWLMFISVFRDELPWLYEVGMEMYRALRSEDPERIALAHHRLQGVLRFAQSGPWMDEVFGFDDKETHMLFRHLPDLIEHYLANVLVKISAMKVARPARAKREDAKSTGPEK